MDFKKWLQERKYKGAPISLCTVSQTLRFLKKFFQWLQVQPGYKSKIKLSDIEYLKLTEKEERVAHQSTPRKYPLLEYVQNLIKSIQGQTEIDMRDRALISFTLLSGGRDSAIVSLSMGCFDEQSKIVYQDPKRGVKTKFNKYVETTLFGFDKELMEYFIGWFQYLKNKGYGSTSPIFPRTKVIQGLNGNLSFQSSNEVEPEFWSSAGPMRTIFKERAKAAGLPYFSPHCFRHLAILLAAEKCRSMDEFKAVSQNVGHESLMTTIPVYGNYSEDKLSEMIQKIDFSRVQKPSTDEKIEELKNLILAQLNKTL